MAVAAYGWKWSTGLETFAFVSGAICVWLVVRENIWNFPVGLVNVSLYAYVFFQDRLYADAGLQIVYFLLGVVGWIYWMRPSGEKLQPRIVRVSYVEALWVVAACVLSTAGLWSLLERVGGSIAFWDGLTASISLGSQWLLTRKRLENWLGWILVDIIYVPMYVHKGLYLTALLYAMFLGMAILGYIEWRQQLFHHLNQPEESQ